MIVPRESSSGLDNHPRTTQIKLALLEWIQVRQGILYQLGRESHGAGRQLRRDLVSRPSRERRGKKQRRMAIR